MNEPVPSDGGLVADRIEITNFVQEGPAKMTSMFGTRLDYTDAGKMMFAVDVVETDGGRLTLECGTSYEKAIIEAEEAAAEWQVAVHDLVGACDD
jgi:hypothetical protein